MIWLIHGTFSDPDTWEDDFVDYVETLFDEKSEKLRWSGENKKGARSDYAEAMLKRIMEWHEENPNDPIRLVGHNHGGNVAIMLANLLAEEGMEVETLITIATPVRGYKLETEVGQHIHVYNRADQVQVSGGFLFFAIAERTFRNATNIEVDIPFKQSWNLRKNHSIMHSNVDVWKEYIESHLK